MGLCNCGERETVEHVVMACPGYEREMMATGLRKVGVREINFNNILECEKSREGRRINFRYLLSTGLIKRM